MDLASPLANDNPGLRFPPADAAYPFVIHRNTVAAIGQGVQQLLVKLSPNLATPICLTGPDDVGSALSNTERSDAYRMRSAGHHHEIVKLCDDL